MISIVMNVIAIVMFVIITTKQLTYEERITKWMVFIHSFKNNVQKHNFSYGVISKLSFDFDILITTSMSRYINIRDLPKY